MSAVSYTHLDVYKRQHPAPFNLKFVGIGNEQWGKEYPERLEPFIKAIRKAHPEIIYRKSPRLTTGIRGNCKRQPRKSRRFMSKKAVHG